MVSEHGHQLSVQHQSDNASDVAVVKDRVETAHSNFLIWLGVERP
jgi:hypothetical protein